MSFFRKIGNSFAGLMYGRCGMDQMGLALIWLSLIVDVVAMFVGRRFALAGSILYYVTVALWAWAVFRIFSKNVYKRREENAKYLSLVWRLKSGWQGSRTRHADKSHKYFTCKSCKAICRVPVGKGKIVITCPKCGAQIHAKT